MKKNLKKLLTFKAILIGIFGGIVLGVYFPNFSQDFSLLGTLYISLLKMCALPILVTAVVTSFAHALQQGDVARIMGRSFFVFCFFMIVAGLLGIFIGELSSPLLMENASVKEALSKLLINDNMANNAPVAEFSLKTLFLSLVPDNVFRVLAEGQLLPLLFFMILFGISLGLERTKNSERVLEVLEGTRLSIFRIMTWFFYLLPLSLASMIAKSISSSGQETLQALMWLLIGGIGTTLLYAVGQFSLLCFVTRRTPLSLARDIREPILVAFGTSSSLAALPSSLKIVTEKLKRESIGTNLVLPLGISFNGQGTVLFHAWITILIGQIYNVQFSLWQYGLIVSGCILRAVTSAGVPASVSIMGITLIFNPLGLPVETVIALLTVLFPFLDPFLTLNNVLGNIIAGTLVADRSKS